MVKKRRGEEIVIPYHMRNYVALIALTFTSSKYGLVINMYVSVLFDYLWNKVLSKPSDLNSVSSQMLA